MTVLIYTILKSDRVWDLKAFIPLQTYLRFPQPKEDID